VRTKTLDSFRSGELTFLVASDVAARGLDIPATSHIFNFDVPYHPDDYVHRIGRTGRAGRGGAALMLATSRDGHYIEAIEKLTKMTLSRRKLEGLAEAPKRARRATTVRDGRAGTVTRSRPSPPRASGEAARPGRRDGAGQNGFASPARTRPQQKQHQPRPQQQPRQQQQPKPQKPQPPPRETRQPDTQQLPAFLLRPSFCPRRPRSGRRRRRKRRKVSAALNAFLRSGVQNSTVTASGIACTVRNANRPWPRPPSP